MNLTVISNFITEIQGDSEEHDDNVEDDDNLQFFEGFGSELQEAQVKAQNSPVNLKLNEKGQRIHKKFFSFGQDEFKQINS